MTNLLNYLKSEAGELQAGCSVVAPNQFGDYRPLSRISARLTRRSVRRHTYGAYFRRARRRGRGRSRCDSRIVQPAGRVVESKPIDLSLILDSELVPFSPSPSGWGEDKRGKQIPSLPASLPRAGERRLLLALLRAGERSAIACVFPRRWQAGKNKPPFSRLRGSGDWAFRLSSIMKRSIDETAIVAPFHQGIVCAGAHTG